MTDDAGPVMGSRMMCGEAERCLRALAREHARLRWDQWTGDQRPRRGPEAALVVQRTGWGKPAVHFATALLRARGTGPTVIVSPLLALMRNQIGAAGRVGIHARLIDDRIETGRIETGRTMTVAAKLLREASAPAVLPPALAISAG